MPSRPSGRQAKRERSIVGSPEKGASMEVLRSSEVQDANQFYKIAYCKRCDKQRTVAKESGLCEKCAAKWLSSFIDYLCQL